ncbi:Glycerol-3-phosphate dehydrogenase [Colletotrichum higginsianum IMI 349063]|uniref:glycerol-3-phosphate dehydrogenase n=1 Tax=Colletotrichum higginsianum (strain IMI 349063) TaxID=759273 RepID=A0A1B7XVA1_COLHI|nr:Glycerol-3-phosphate dehydrogenase [Colletotrichum higginsianum IMI 349063]OBR03681.1 Glycerol-3-phosphate dehydrogenase [Colletotrichum higginsianum IMI 349063]
MGSARDRQTPPPHEIRIRAKFIINCTGPFTDSLRKMDDHNCKTIVAPVSRVYAILPGQHGPRRPLHVRRPRHLLPTVAGQNHRWHHQRARVHHAESAARRKVDWMDPKLVRNHLVDVSASGPLTCADSQLTTYPELRRPRLVRRHSLPAHRQARRAPLLRGPDLARGSAQGHGHRDQGAEMTGTGDGKISSGEKMRCRGDAAVSHPLLLHASVC